LARQHAGYPLLARAAPWGSSRVYFLLGPLKGFTATRAKQAAEKFGTRRERQGLKPDVFLIVLRHDY
jgi:hypothetical protein